MHIHNNIYNSKVWNCCWLVDFVVWRPVEFTEILNINFHSFVVKTTISKTDRTHCPVHLLKMLNVTTLYKYKCILVYTRRMEETFYYYVNCIANVLYIYAPKHAVMQSKINFLFSSAMKLFNECFSGVYYIIKFLQRDKKSFLIIFFYTA